MRKILFLFYLLYSISIVQAQVGLSLNTAVQFQIVNPGSSGTNPNFTVSGFISDDISRWDATSIFVGDSLYVLDGSELFVFVITDINFAAGSSLNIDVQAIDAEPTSIPPGQAAIVHPTSSYGYPTYISSLRDDLRSLMLNRAMTLIDKDVRSADEIAFTSGGTVPASSVATVDGYRLAKNLSGDGTLYKWDGAMWIPDGITSFTSGGALGELEIVDNDITFGVPILDIAPVQDINAGNDDILVTNLPAGEVQLKIGQQAASSGQVLKWNGTQWAPAADNDTGGGGGVTDGDKGDITVSGTGTVYTLDPNTVDSTHLKNRGISMFDIGQNGAGSGQVIKWNGNMWIPSTDATGSTPALTNTHIFVGNASNVATDVAVTGDISITNTGVVTVKGIGGSEPYYGSFTNSSPSGTQNNWSVIGVTNFTQASSVIITGFASTISSPLIPFCYAINSGTGTITLKHEDAGSTATNRFTLPGSVDYVIQQGDAVMVARYNSRWRVLSNSGYGITNLSVANNTTTTLDVLSNTGTDATIPAATNSLAGLQTSAGKTKESFITITQAVDLDALEAASHTAVTVSDNARLDFVLTGQNVTADLLQNGATSGQHMTWNGSVWAPATATDNSITNELQTVSNTSDATSHTLALSNSGGSVQLIEGSNITLTTGGSGSAGTVTIASTSTGVTDLNVTGTSSPLTLTSSTGTDVTITASGIVALTGASGAITIGATEVDGSTTNEVITISDGTDSEAMGGQTLTIAATGGATVDYVPGTNTLTINAGSSSGGDNWGSQVVTHGSTLTGQGIVGNILDVATGGITATELATGAVVLNTGDVTNVLPIANGGSGQATAQLAMNAFAGAVTSGSYLRGNGTNVVMATIQAGDVPTLNQNTTGNAATVTTNANLTGHVTSTGNATVLGSFTSANLSGALTNETGTGVAVFSADPALTGVPTAPTATGGTNTTQLATTAFVTTANATNANLTGMVTSVGNATTVVTNANLTGDVTSSGNATTIADNSVDGTDIAFGSDLLGDSYYHNGTDVVRLAGNITTTKQFWSQVGNGSVSAAPAWVTLAQADIPSASGGDVTGLLSNLQIASGVVGSTEVTDNSLVAGDLAVNVVSSVEGVDNDGGNIDIVGAGITVITSDNTANTITFTSTEVDGSTTNEIQTISTSRW